MSRVLSIKDGGFRCRCLVSDFTGEGVSRQFWIISSSLPTTEHDGIKSYVALMERLSFARIVSVIGQYSNDLLH